MRRHGKTALAAILALVREIGLDEVVLTLALLLIARGCWLAWRPGAYLVPGLVLLWVALPERKAFVSRSSAEKPTRRPS